MTISQVPLTGTFRDMSSNIVTGTIVLRYPVPVRNTGSQLNLPTTPITITLTTNGQIPAGTVIYATDDSDTDPDNLYIEVVEKLGTAPHTRRTAPIPNTATNGLDYTGIVWTTTARLPTDQAYAPASQVAGLSSQLDGKAAVAANLADMTDKPAAFVEIKQDATATNTGVVAIPVVETLEDVADGDLPAGWTDGSAHDSTEYCPVGKAAGALSILDPDANTGYPDSYPAIGFAWKDFGTAYTDDFEIVVDWSGILPIEGTALAYVTLSGAGLDWLGYGAWPSHDYLGQGPAFLISPISGTGDSSTGDPDTFSVGGGTSVGVALFTHTTGTRRKIAYRFSGGEMEVWLEDPDTGVFEQIVGTDARTSWPVPATLLSGGSTRHGIAIDAHYATPSYPPNGVSPVPAPTEPAIYGVEVRKLAGSRPRAGLAPAEQISYEIRQHVAQDDPHPDKLDKTGGTLTGDLTFDISTDPGKVVIYSTAEGHVVGVFNVSSDTESAVTITAGLFGGALGLGPGGSTLATWALAYTAANVASLGAGDYLRTQADAVHANDLPRLSQVETLIATAVSNLVDGAPGALDTLNELAAALGDDASFATTVTNALAAKAALAGAAFTGVVSVDTGSDPGKLVITSNAAGHILQMFNAAADTQPSVAVTSGLFGGAIGLGAGGSTAPDVTISRTAAGILGLPCLDMGEQTAPGSPAADRVRIYAEDNGSGKTRVMAKFADGSTAQIAIQP